MREDFLHYIWKTGQFDIAELCTTDGLPITIRQKGLHNHLAGPDFQEAIINIDGVRWAGSVEIHVRSSDWIKHKHGEDPLYRNVILHVVWEEDVPIRHSNKDIIPCLSLRKRVHRQAVYAYNKLMLSSDRIPCAFGIKNTDSLTLHAWMDRLMVERLDRKKVAFQILDERYNNDTSRVFYTMLCRNFGFGINHDAFDAIAHHLDYHILLKHKNNLTDLEALFFGMAGLLEHLQQPDTYTLDLYRRFSHWKKKYGLIPRNKNALHFFKLRPANFPTIRLAQLAFFFHKVQHPVSKILEYTHEKQYRSMFDIEVSDYWKEHYDLGKKSKRKMKGKLSTPTLRLLLINTIVPFLYYYGVKNKDQSFIDRAMSILQSLPPEKNHIINQWQQLDITPRSALDAQALLHLKKYYCDEKKCMHCAVGHKIIQSVQKGYSPTT